ncbi:hypothetical protein K1719_006984 [Acacia pycnantha]|nr:hypothetical protein K1719_006984 [Acacia pycnantha]
MEPSGFAKRLMRIYKSEEDLGMVKSMDLDMDDPEPLYMKMKKKERRIMKRVEDEEVEKEIIEEKRVGSVQNLELTPSSNLPRRNTKQDDDHCFKHNQEEDKDSDSSRLLLRIQNIFTLCGNQRELSHFAIIQNTSVSCFYKNEEVDTWHIWHFASDIVMVMEEEKVENKEGKAKAKERWLQLEKGWVKVNSDRAGKGDPGELLELAVKCNFSLSSFLVLGLQKQEKQKVIIKK